MAAPVAKIGATPEAIKKARDFGFHAEVFSGKTFFCREDATVGTRLTSKRCIDAMQFEDYAVQLQIARDTMYLPCRPRGRPTGWDMPTRRRGQRVQSLNSRSALVWKNFFLSSAPMAMLSWMSTSSATN